ncbi:MAG TPA: alpha/beta hydrolase [Ktedonobacterales bacterium]|nr:alpha/beta hydrolase [Ktedonobacterales bacterium]
MMSETKDIFVPTNQSDTADSWRTLVLLHGSGYAAPVWDDLSARLHDGPFRTIVAPDLPGHGARAGEPPPAPASVAAYAADVRAGLERHGLAGVTLLGHSLGSAIALRLALAAPHLVARVGLVGAGARLRVLPALLTAARDQPEEARRQVFTLALTPSHADRAAGHVARMGPLAPGALFADLSACDGFDMMADLGGIAQPCLIVVGMNDQLTPPKYAAYLAAHLPHATLRELPDAGHSAHLDAPDSLAHALTEWAG